MTFEQIKNLKLEDFKTRNEEVWDSIKNLSLEQVEKLFSIFNDNEINLSLSEVFNEKLSNLLASIIDFNKLNNYEKEKLLWFLDTFEEEVAAIIWLKLEKSLT